MPPITIARWYGGQADVPSVFIFVSRNPSSRSGDRIARVSWNRKLLFALAAALGDEHQMELVGVVPAGAAMMSNCTGRLLPVFTSSNIDSGAICE